MLTACVSFIKIKAYSYIFSRTEYTLTWTRNLIFNKAKTVQQLKNCGFIHTITGTPWFSSFVTKNMFNPRSVRVFSCEKLHSRKHWVGFQKLVI